MAPSTIDLVNFVGTNGPSPYLVWIEKNLRGKEMTTVVFYARGSNEHERIIKHRAFRQNKRCFDCKAEISEDSDIVVRHGRFARYYHAKCAKRLKLTTNN